MGVSGSFVTNFPATQDVEFTTPQHVIVDSLPGGASSVVDVSDRTARVLGHVIVDSAPAAGADVTDRSARLLGHVTVDNASLAVTGTFWQTTQPVSGTFWQTTQPVSLATNTPDVTDRSARLLGHVTVDNASIAVTGSFWQATQPVSGTFWQATQPVSGTVTANAGTNLNTSALALDATLTGGTQQSKITDGTNVATVKAASTAAGATDKAVVVAVSPNNTVGVTGTFWQATQPVSGTFWQATQPVSLATNTPDVTDRAARLLGHVTVDNASLAVTGTFWQATQPVSGTVTANAGTNLNTSALALDATITGGTQQSKITDGTNVATVKAASTQAVAADKALVVAWSPNMGPTNNFLLPSAAATINATAVKASAGRLYKIKGYNAAAAVRYIKFWNKATAPAPASDAALIMFAYPLKASDQFDIDLTPIGFAFTTGIGLTISTGSANTDATAVTAADIVGLNVMYA
jgi:hypothetical protein